MDPTTGAGGEERLQALRHQGDDDAGQHIPCPGRRQVRRRVAIDRQTAVGCGDRCVEAFQQDDAIGPGRRRPDAQKPSATQIGKQSAELALMVAAFDQRRKSVQAALNGLDGFSCIEPAGAFYAFPNITGTGRSAAELQDLLLEKAGVATIAGTSFGEYGEGYLRVSYANSEENILKAIARIGDAL